MSAAAWSPPPLRLYYDDRCGFCTATRDWLTREALPGQLDFVGLSTLTPEAMAALGRSLNQMQSRMHVETPDGRVLAGADALPELLRCLPRWRWAAAFWWLPGSRKVLRWGYDWVARNRLSPWMQRVFPLPK